MERPWVLLVDDNEATRTLIVALLQKQYQVDVAADGNEAIAKLTTRRYAVILLDLLMPHADGFDVLEHIATTAPGLLRSVLVVTAALTPPQLDRVNRYGVWGLVRKPFEVDTLLKAVSACVRQLDGSSSALITSGMWLLLAQVLRHRLM